MSPNTVAWERELLSARAPTSQHHTHAHFSILLSRSFAFAPVFVVCVWDARMDGIQVSWSCRVRTNTGGMEEYVCVCECLCLHYLWIVHELRSLTSICTHHREREQNIQLWCSVTCPFLGNFCAFGFIVVVFAFRYKILLSWRWCNSRAENNV